VIRGALPGAAAHFHDDMLALWVEDGHTTIVFEEPREDRVRAFIESSAPGAEFLWEGKLHYRDWESNRDVRPVHTAGFLICPSWDVREPEACERRIVLDPGLSFGSGHHPATQIALGLLRVAFAQQPPARVLDLGCGTGVLSVAAVLLGAARVTAVDNSQLAIHAANLNAELNLMNDRIDIIHGDVFKHIDDAADLVICNINFPVIRELIKRPKFLRIERLLLSGVNPESEHERTVEALRVAGRRILETRRIGAWFGYLTLRH
jgi:ribosomal protein L11 methyltransferase